MNIILVGHIGSGKTSIGRKLAVTINFDYIDLDNTISDLHKKIKGERLTSQEIFGKYGNSYFRKLEKKAVITAIVRDDSVISTGGGTLEDEESAEILKRSGKIIFLEVGISILAERLKNYRHRPIFKNSDPIKILNQMNEKRTPLFKKFADVTIDASSGNIKDILDNLMEAIQ